MNKKILDSVNNYYTEKIITNGATPQGVDWNSAESQHLRFEILSSVIEDSKPFSVLDYGCGFGSMFEYYQKQFTEFQFHGFDISEEMIKNAIHLYGKYTNSNWYTQIENISPCDYVIVSGIFNVRLKNNDEEWLNYIIETLNIINQKATKGFSVNLLTSYSDKEYMKDYLYYADPLFLFDYCKKHFSKWVNLKHDYPLYEFTLIVKK